jgi:aminopeptidase
MRDARTDKLAGLIIEHSTRLKPGEVILIEPFDVADGLVLDLVEAAQKAGGIPLVHLRNQQLIRQLIERGTEAQFAAQADIELYQMKKAQAYVGIRGADNASELAGIKSDQMRLYTQTVSSPVHMEQRVNHTKWVVLRYPTASMAQLAQMGTRAFEDFFYKVCTLDYPRMAASTEPLVTRMKETNEVRIKGPGTDLRFSIKDIGVVPCYGRRNLPDGECFTAPVRDSVNGTIAFNTPSLYMGTSYRDIRFTFESGRIVKAEGEPAANLKHLLDTDEGARHVGEFSLGFNPFIEQPMKDTLFDEKIAGSLHFTPGQAYGEADNGNRSRIHWDLVLIQRPDFGGGSIWFDGECIRRDGRFIVPDLEGLNPEKLAG